MFVCNLFHNRNFFRSLGIIWLNPRKTGSLDALLNQRITLFCPLGVAIAEILRTVEVL